MATDLAAERYRTRPGGHPAAGDGEVRGIYDEDLVAAALGLEHEDERGVGPDVDGFDRVHDEGERQRANGHSGTPVPVRSGSAGAGRSATVG